MLITDVWNYEMHAQLVKFLLYWMLEMGLNLNILQLFFLVYLVTMDSNLDKSC